MEPPPGAPGKARLLKAGGGLLQPDIWVITDSEGRESVWKTWGRRPAWEQATLARWLARREADIIRALQDLHGFPQFLARPDSVTIEMSLLDAEPVPEVKRGGELTTLYFMRLRIMLDAMHRRGINHGDLRRKNLLRAPGNPDVPRMVDFTQCFHFQTPVAGLRKIIFREAKRVDDVTYVKLKRWYLGEDSLTEEEKRIFADIPWHLKLGRFLRKKVYRRFKHWRKGQKAVD